MVCRLCRLAVFGVLALTMLGCAEKIPERPVLPEPSASVPAGMKEVSRLEGHNEAVKPGTAQSADKISGDSANRGAGQSADKSSDTGSAQSPDLDVTAVSGDVRTDKAPCGKGESGSPASSDGSAAAMSKGDNVNSSDMSNGKSGVASGAKSAGGEDDYQTVKTTAITSRGEFPWTLDAEKVQYSENNQRVRVSAIVWSLLDENDKPRLTVRGRAADVNVESQNVAFDGPVDATGSQGETMHVNHLVWDSAKQKILGSHGVKVVRKGTVMTGERLTASPDLKQVEVSGNVHVQFLPTAVGESEAASF